MHRQISTRTSTRVIWASGTERGDQPTPLPQPMALLEDMPVAPTVALPVPHDRPAVISSTPRALVRRPMTFLVKSMPVKALARGNGTPLPARISGAICALPTPTPCVATDSRGSARSEDFVHSCMNGLRRSQDPARSMSGGRGLLAALSPAGPRSRMISKGQDDLKREERWLRPTATIDALPLINS